MAAILSLPQCINTLKLTLIWVITAPDNGLVSVWHQAIIWTKACLLSIGPIGPLRFNNLHTRKWIRKCCLLNGSHFVSALTCIHTCQIMHGACVIVGGVMGQRCVWNQGWIYRQVSNISGTLVGNKIVDHSDVVGASPVGAAPTTSSFST